MRSEATTARSITLSDEDYQTPSAAAARTGTPLDDRAHQAIAEHFAAPEGVRQIGSFQYPTGEPLTDEEEGEMERLAQDIGSEHPWAPEMVIEDRGPR